MSCTDPTALLTSFRQALPPVARMGEDLVGKGAMVDGPFGPKPLVYADYVASGRALKTLEMFLLESVLPYYANSHTEASFCGGFMTRLRAAARATIADHCGAGPEHAVIFAGSGATAGINRLVHLLGADHGKVKVILGPYEHHSNILPWRESGAEVVELPEAGGGGPELAALDAALADKADYDRVICAFSAASNVSGIIADVAGLTRRAKEAGALMVWDYAGGGPYLPMAMDQQGAGIDALVFSPHKFIGGPGASGVMVLRRDAVVAEHPTWVGGGTVRFVSSDGHDYSGALEAREEAGTPNVVGDIRAALAVIVKEEIGADHMAQRNAELAARAIVAWQAEPGIELLGNTGAARLPVLSFRLRDPRGGYIHQQLATKMLSDRFGIQARGGCACAGPYVLRLLGFDTEAAARIRAAILSGQELEKPGFVRLNLSVLMSEAEVDFILQSVATLSRDAVAHVGSYEVDGARAIFSASAA
ncbi:MULTISPECIES: aminotransferase class V-fold PLP-dependent enzyme [unclassified Salipiger]|uniref:aminotransferase class V-fold PLP-dependent enzyme n=1 Tax=unclassified Salipiger TaxID=2640570 RepID=UPI0013BE64BB|nr:aminotransferase class V-fold PLP-dependent enzyme [Salipiger sp. PrR003]NDW35313.1 aminotransferase class V-fold PLP-dependent enzyme [Salipiger sp. PrR007]